MRLLPVLLAGWFTVMGAACARAQPCEAAGAAAERRHEVPEGLLRAIGRVESGRRDPASGQVAAWPWTINAEGRGRVFDSAADALAAAEALRRGGTGSIDVGCYQVNLLHHPGAFASLEEGFDPERNADYAARFLKALRGRTGSWDDAVAAYHSASPERGVPYRDRVLAAWQRGGGAPALPAAAAVTPVLRVVSWSAPAGGGAMRVWSPSAPGQGASVIAISPGRAPRG